MEVEAVCTLLDDVLESEQKDESCFAKECFNGISAIKGSLKEVRMIIDIFLVPFSTFRIPEEGGG